VINAAMTLRVVNVATAYLCERTVSTARGLALRRNGGAARREAAGAAAILNWMTTLHGYLSSPTGGGVRHGVDLKSGIAIQAHEARLYCNLIRSYITYMIEEHERRTRAPF
jgi:hypothetical protein